MGIRSTLSSILSAPLAAALEAKVRQAAEDALRAQDLADPATVRELAAKVDQTHRAIEGLRAEVTACQDAIVALQEDEPSDHDDLLLQIAGLSARDASLTEAIEATKARIDALSDEVVTVRKHLDATDARVASTETVATAAKASATATKAATKAAALPPGDKGCKVPGCDGKHRARGFCARHYQLWKRNNLPGFVNSDGTVFFEEDGPRKKVADTHLGKPAEADGTAILIDGKRVKSTKA